MACRREPGEGSISWSNTHQYWVGTLIIGKKDNGRNKLKTFRSRTPGRAGYRDVEAQVDAYKKQAAETAQHKAAASSQRNYSLWQCIQDWVAWVPSQQETSEGTAAKYLGQCRKWVRPAIGDVSVFDLDLEILSNFAEDIAPHMGADSMQDILSTIRRSLQYAMRDKTRTGYTGPNPANDVVPPKAGHGRRPWDVLTREQVELILTQTMGTPAHALMMTGFFLGLRPGEIRALKWEHVDFEHSVLSVVEYARVEGDGETKTELSRRALPLPARLWAALWEHEAQYRGADDYVFHTAGGEQFSKDTLRNLVVPVFKAAGLAHQDAYVTRHTFCSVAYADGLPNRDIARLMGHANEAVFLRVYAHYLPPRVEVDGRRLNDIWGDNSGAIAA